MKLLVAIIVILGATISIIEQIEEGYTIEILFGKEDTP